MKINLFIGNSIIRDKDILNGIDDYYKRINRFNKINIINKIDNKILSSDSSYNINISPMGRYINSIEFSNIIKYNSINRTKNINIVFDYNKINFDNICFVNFEISRDFLYILVLEQIYRSYKIINNEPYHK